ncbi:hypothetical protein HPB47_024148, partial [Ixodes persulcatus]
QDPAITCVNLIAISTCQSLFLTHCIKTKFVPPEVRALFGLVEPSWGHARRVGKIVKSEHWRQRVRMNLPPKKKGAATCANNVTVLGDVYLPGDVRMTREKGPKYSYEPSSKPHELLGMVRRVANRASEQNREQAISEGVDCLKHTVSRKPRK